MSYPYIFRSLIILICLNVFMSYTKENTAPEAIKPQIVNTFAMQVNGQDWEPGRFGKEPRNRTFNAAWSWLDRRPFFNISAYRDSNGKTGAESDNSLQLQIMDAGAAGSYGLRGSYLKSFSSHAFFWSTKPEGSKVRYVNSESSNAFKVVFEQFTERPNTTLKGVKGSFFGTLYNEKDPSDFIVIKRGYFSFQRTNGYDFRQCE